MGKHSSKVALITGAAGDIGSAVAKKLYEEGAILALVDIDEDRLENVVYVLREQFPLQGVIKSFVCDIKDYSDVIKMNDSVLQTFGTIDLLFNNAGYQGLFMPTYLYPADDFKKVIMINLIGAFHVLQVVSETMKRNKGGLIVNTASMAGVAYPPNMVAYSASKAGVIGLTGATALDLAPYNIRVNSISPAFMGPGNMWDRQVELQAKANSQYYSLNPDIVAEEMVRAIPMRRLGSMEEIASVVSFLLSEDSSYLTGVNIPISGGIR
ncbi:MAG: SDR family NAD(P)-dependent oxidoreductase [Balneolaceae bacterium]